METRERPNIEYPFRAALKVIGSKEELQAQAIAEVIHAHIVGEAEPLPETWVDLYGHSAQAKGAWISHTFWVTLPDEHTEKPMREAIHKLPGIVMQL